MSLKAQVFLFAKKAKYILKRKNSSIKKGVFAIKQELRVNEGIDAIKVKVISEEGEQLGEMELSQALDYASSRDLDLVEVAPGQDVPVCKVMNYGKYKYEQARKEKEAKKKQKIVDTKEIRLSSTIDTHDFEFKAKNKGDFSPFYTLF